MLILASRSPQRRAILKQLGIDFEVVVPEVEELAEGEPEAVVLQNARMKAMAVLDDAPAGALVLGVDTEVELDGRIFGKPTDRDQARAYITELAGRTHIVWGGVVLLESDRPVSVSQGDVKPGRLPLERQPRDRSGIAETAVTFRPLDEGLLDRYLASGEWRERAGGYAVQGLGASLVERIEGDFWNVVGLPVPLLVEIAPELLARS